MAQSKLQLQHKLKQPLFQILMYENSHIVIYGYIEAWTYHPMLNISVIPQKKFNLSPSVFWKLYSNQEGKTASVYSHSHWVQEYSAHIATLFLIILVEHQTMSLNYNLWYPRWLSAISLIKLWSVTTAAGSDLPLNIILKWKYIWTADRSWMWWNKAPLNLFAVV